MQQEQMKPKAAARENLSTYLVTSMRLALLPSLIELYNVNKVRAIGAARHGIRGEREREREREAYLWRRYIYMYLFLFAFLFFLKISIQDMGNWIDAPVTAYARRRREEEEA
jgi:hypothetical protein